MKIKETVKLNPCICTVQKKNINGNFNLQIRLSIH